MMFTKAVGLAFNASGIAAYFEGQNMTISDWLFIISLAITILSMIQQYLKDRSPQVVQVVGTDGKTPSNLPISK